MNARLAGPDHSLNATIRGDSQSEWQDWLVDNNINQEQKLEEKEEFKYRKTIRIYMSNKCMYTT